MAEVHVSDGETPLAGIEVTVSDKPGTSPWYSATTDASGMALFRLPSGVYRFVARLPDAELQATAALVAHQATTVNLRRGNSFLALTLLRDKSTPLAGVVCSLDDANGTSAVTDREGRAVFPVEAGTYTITAHYLGGEFSTAPLAVPGVSGATLLIEHQDVTITVYGNQGEEVVPLAGANCELVRGNGETTGSTGLSAVSDAEGRVTFSVPLQQYMLRVSYLGGTFLSEPFDWYDTEMYIPLGTIGVQVYAPDGQGKGGGSAVDIPILLYSDNGAYLEVTRHTDGYGQAIFPVPAGWYQFCAEYQGTVYWSRPVQVAAGDSRWVDIFLDMELSRYDPVNNPFPTRYDGVPPIYHALLAGTGSLPSLPSASPVVATDPAVYYPLNDHLGTAQLIVDDQRQIVWQANAFPFGALDSIIDLLPDHFRFPGQYFDEETGLHYNWHRYYDPESGRYLTPDPIGLDGGGNLYGYVQNNPVNMIDPWGLCRKSGEGVMDCVNRQAEEAFGDLLAVCDTAGYYGLGSMAIATGSNLLASAGNYAATTGINNANAAGAYTSGNILKKQAAATAGAKTAARIGALKGALSVVSKASGVIGISGTIGSVGMRAAFINDCMEECNDCSTQ